MNKRKTIAIAVAAFILLPLFFSGGLQLFQVYLKQRAIHKLETETLTQVKVPLEQVKWMEAGREVMINGKMFDLKTYAEADGFFTATGVWDEKETQVMEWLNHFNDQQQTGLVIRLLLLSQSLLLIYYLLQHISWYRWLRNTFSDFDVRITHPFQPVQAQPPRRLFA